MPPLFNFAGKFILPLTIPLVIADESQQLKEEMFNLKMSRALSIYYIQKSRKSPTSPTHLSMVGIKNQVEIMLNLYYWNIHHIILCEQIISLSINTNLITNPNYKNDIKLQGIKESYVSFGGTYFHSTNIWLFTLYEA